MAPASNQVEGRLGALGHIVAAGAHHFGAGCERHQRRPQLVADITGESGVPLDASLKCGCHVVERVGEYLQVLIVGWREAGIEASTGDRLGRPRRIAEWSHGTARGEPTDQATDHGGDCSAKGETQRNVAKRSLVVRQFDELEVRRLGEFQRRPDDERQDAVDTNDQGHAGDADATQTGQRFGGGRRL
jgi:hypothetical protein